MDKEGPRVNRESVSMSRMTGTGSLNTVDVHMIWGEERKKTKQALEKEGVEGGGEGEEVK